MTKEIANDNDADGSQPTSAVRGRCPICGNATVVAMRPFCSRRCADVDLARWLGGRYAIAGRPLDEEDEVQAQAQRSAGGQDRPPE